MAKAPAAKKLPEGIQAWAIDQLIEKLAENGFTEFSAKDLAIRQKRIEDHLLSLERKRLLKVIAREPKRYVIAAKNGKIQREARIR